MSPAIYLLLQASNGGNIVVVIILPFALLILTFYFSFTFFSLPLFLLLPFSFFFFFFFFFFNTFKQDCQVFHPRSLPVPTESFLSFLHHSLVESNTFLCPSNQDNFRSLLSQYLITIRANRQAPRNVPSSIDRGLCHPPHHTCKLNIMSRSQSRSCSWPSAFVQAIHHPHGLRPLHDPIPTPKQRLYH